MVRRVVQVLALALIFSWMGKSFPAVPDDATNVQPLEAGQTAPVFTAYTVDGDSYRFDPAQREQPTVLIFYRGGWCPYCNKHLKDLREAEPVLLELGFEVLFLSADRPEILHSSLRREQPSYTILSDASMEVSRAFGIAFVVDDETLARYKKAGLDLEKVSGYTHHQLPVPAVFVIDTNGVIRYAYANPDYRVRLEANAVLEQAAIITSSGPSVASAPGS